MMTFLFWVGLSATTLMLLAIAFEEAVRLSRSRARTSIAEGASDLLPISLARARAMRIVATLMECRR